MLVSLLFVSCHRAPPIPQLFIISPHGSAIRLEFQLAFSAWHQQHYGTPVDVQWPDIGGGGTGNLVRYLDTQYRAANTCGYDLFFGGGSGVFDDLARRGFIVPPNPAIPPEILAAVPASIHGIPLRDKDNRWFAATMSQFGIAYNKARLAELHLPIPQAWADLAAPAWFGHVSVADPSKSGSVRTCYEMILQQYGWDQGWPILVNIFANAEAIQQSGSSPGDETGSGNAAAGIVIDFYGRTAIVKQGASIVGFVVPNGGSTLDPDPIAMLKGAPHADLAAHMIEFALSEEGQKLWTFRPGTPGGPRYNALGRMALSPRLYETGAAFMTDSTNPFTGAPPLRPDQQAQSYRSRFLGDLMKSAIIENHANLRAARQALIAAGNPPQLLALLDQLPTYRDPPSSGEAVPMTADRMKTVAELFSPKDPALAEKNPHDLREHWRQELAARCAQVLAAAKSK